MTTLFSPIPLADLKLSRRVVIAPLTRSRAEAPGGVPGSFMQEADVVAFGRYFISNPELVNRIRN